MPLVTPGRYTPTEMDGLMRRADMDADGELDFHALFPSS